MDAGSLADWVNAGGTLLAFAGAAFAGVVAWRSYHLQQAASTAQLARHASEDERRAALGRRQQAERVAVWIVHDGAEWLVYGVNDSSLPVYRLCVRVHGGPVDATIMRGAQGPTASRRLTKLTAALTGVLDAAGATDPVELAIEVAFTDAAGVRWYRGPDGTLEERDGDFVLPGPVRDERSFPSGRA